MNDNIPNAALTSTLCALACAFLGCTGQINAPTLEGEAPDAERMWPTGPGDDGEGVDDGVNAAMNNSAPGNNGNPGNNGDPGNNAGPANNGEPGNNGAPGNNGDPGNNAAGPCDMVTCPPTASCDPGTGACVCPGGTDLVDDACVPIDPCSEVQCPSLSNCDPDTLECNCTSGTVLRDGVCVELDPGDPAARTEAEVCARFAESNAAIVQPEWTGMDCEPGVATAETIDASVERLNLHRWLTGISPLVHTPEFNRISQLCAVIQAGRGGLEHYPAAGDACYTADGAQAAGRANLSAGGGSTSGPMDRLVADSWGTGVGHRRWILHPLVGQTGIGYATSDTIYRDYWCQYVAGGPPPNPLDPEFIAWPNPGYVPAALVPQFDARTSNTAKWSFHSARIAFGADPQVTITRLSDQTEMEIAIHRPGGGGPQPLVVMEFLGGAIDLDSDYEVTIANISLGGQPIERTYVVKPTGCQ